MNTVTECFGSLVFDDKTMQAKLPRETYKSLQRTIKNGKHLDLALANVVANAMKDWALALPRGNRASWRRSCRCACK